MSSQGSDKSEVLEESTTREPTHKLYNYLEILVLNLHIYATHYVKEGRRQMKHVFQHDKNNTGQILFLIPGVP